MTVWKYACDEVIDGGYRYGSMQSKSSGGPGGVEDGRGSWEWKWDEQAVRRQGDLWRATLAGGLGYI